MSADPTNVPATGSLTRRRLLLDGLKAGGALTLPAAQALSQAPARKQASDRELWLKWVEKVATPVLDALERRELRRRMPVEAAKGHEAERAVGTHLEAMARLLAGLAPWLELDDTEAESSHERGLRTRFRKAAQDGITSAVDPGSPDFMRFGESAQTLVDSSFLSLALLRAPRHLFSSMDSTTRARLVAALQKERAVLPPFSNWLLFAALNEVLLRRLDAAWDRVRVDYALREHEAWYLGDGTYGDGPHFHADFYNSYVIQPYLLALFDELADEPVGRKRAEVVRERARRYAALQERSISPAGEFPVEGRSITYRAGAFHLLADIAWRGMLPEPLREGGVRAALTAVQHRTLDAPGTFSREGWLQIGLAGHQPGLGETYISTGSLYLCSTAWLPLGLPAGHSFWTAASADWTQKKIWAGADAPPDHALAD